MTIKLIDELRRCISDGSTDLVCVVEAVIMLEQQAKEIEDFRFVLRNLTLATSKKISELEEELKMQGRLPKQSLVEDLNDMHIAKSILRAENHFKFGEKK
jgi:hypothetical protein